MSTRRPPSPAIESHPDVRRAPAARTAGTPRKQRSTTGAAIDPVTLAVLNGRLEQIADEMDATLFRAAFNPIIAEAHDASHGLYDANNGETLVQGKSGLPIFVGAMSFAVRLVIDRFGSELADGDVFIFNDAYEGGTHFNDVKLVRPFFYRGELFCHLASVGHWHDVGGNVPGNYNPVATECFQEAFFLPPVRLYAGGIFRPDILAILTANSRLPKSVYGDLNGQVNALELGVRRLTELLDHYGVATVRQAFSELRARAVRLIRENIASLPDGHYSCTDYLDNDGSVDRALPIVLDIDKRGSGLRLDFSRSAAACAGPVNISRATTIAACYVALKHLFPDVPANAGVLDPIEIVIAPGSLLDARAPRPVGGYTETILRIIDVIFGALAAAAPDRVNGMAYGTINALSIAGHRANGSRWVMFSFFGGGHGGHPSGDGLNHGNAPISTATIPPLEILEAAYPIAFTQWSLRPDSGGKGQYRGGLGAIYEIELLESEAEAFFFGERARFAPQGVLGGEPGALNRFDYQSGGRWHSPPLGSKMVGIHLRRGERIRLQSPGGGGYGPPRKRSAKARAEDLRQGYVSTTDQPSNEPARRRATTQTPGKLAPAKSRAQVTGAASNERARAAAQAPTGVAARRRRTT